MSTSSPIAQTIDVLSREKNIDPNVIIAAIEEAVIKAARKQFNAEQTGEELRARSESEKDQWRKRLPHLVRLTAREQQVALLVCKGRSNAEIAEDVHLSLPMVKKHLYIIFRKLEVSSRSRLMALLA